MTRRWGRLGLVAILAASVFTIVVVQWSTRHGRLAFYPTYDDVTYLIDGLHRLQGVADRGAVMTLLDVLVRPPHAPVNTAIAAGAFAVAGVRDTAPYYGNALVVMLLLVRSFYAAGVRSCAGAFVVTVATLCLPLTFWAVHEFRPDFLYGLLCAGSIVAAPSRARHRRDPAAATAPSGSPRRVCLTLSGSVDASTLEWLADSHKLGLLFEDLVYSTDLAEFQRAFAENDYVVAPAMDAPGVYGWLRAAKLRTGVLQELNRPGSGFVVLRAPSHELPYFIFRIPRARSRPDDAAVARVRPPSGVGTRAS